MTQDFLGIFTAIFLFTLILVIPGYVIGHIFDLFDFRLRQPLVRLGIGLLLSSAISPVLFFLTYRLISNLVTFIVLFGFAILFVSILFRQRDFGVIRRSLVNNRFARAILWITILWTLLAILLLIDIQWGNRLYFNIVAYDYSTRATVVNAITRSGVPPVNPSFYPGEPVKLTFLYYFWYVLCSLIDQLGGRVVDSRAALMASAVWAGLALMATVALYLRIRTPVIQSNKWRSALLGIGLLSVSGLDLLTSSFYIIYPQFVAVHAIDGDIEQWNEQITAWVGTTLWTPHHLVGLLNCILGWVLVLYHLNKGKSQKISSAVIAGMGFASAFGLSSWVTLIFVFFWIIWIMTKLLEGSSIKKLWSLFLPGMIGAALIFPFLLDLFSGSGGSPSAGRPLAFDVRWFWPVASFVIDLPDFERTLVHLLLLPLNYFFELGFFLLVGIYWYRLCGKEKLEKNLFARGEIILLLTSVILATFIRSTLIGNNDFGWRGWLAGQFILLVWGTDIISYIWGKQPNIRISFFRRPVSLKGARTLLISLLAVGVLTSVQDILLLRTWPLLIDTDLLIRPDPVNYHGERVHEARKVYELIDHVSPAEAIVQSSPGLGVDRPAGLYRTRNSVIASHTLYGVAPELYGPLTEGVGQLFETENSNWQSLDASCEQYSIDVLIIKDSDRLWQSQESLKSERQPLFAGKYFAAFYCGIDASNND